MHYADIKIYEQNAFKASAPYSVICNTSNPTHNHNNTMTSTLLYDKACIAAQKANEKRQKTNQLRFNAARLSVPDELYWYNNNTNWSALTRKEFRETMILMETITMRFYDDYGDCVYPNRNAAIKKFWAEEWDCEYSPESGEWWDLSSNERIESETEKKARREAAKAAEKEAKAAAKAEKKAAKAAKAAKKQQQQQQSYQYNDEEEELYIQALTQQEQKQEQQQQQQQQSYDEWYDAEEEAYAEAYAKARAADELKQQQEAQTYLDQKEEKEEQKPRVACQPVLYVEELTDVAGDPDWRAYIYYDARIRRYVFKGTRRSLKTLHCKKTSYPEVKLCFRSSREMASFLCASTDVEMNISMFAMASATVKDATFAELYALPARGSMTELFGYDRKYMRYSTFVDYLCMLRDVDASHSNFAAF